MKNFSKIINQSPHAALKSKVPSDYEQKINYGWPNNKNNHKLQNQCFFQWDKL